MNEAVEIAHREGILTAASLMMRGSAVDDAVLRARTMPRLGVGLHIVLTDGRPVLPPEQVLALLGADGAFHPSMLRTALLIAFWPPARAQMRAEVAAQFAAFAATGLPLDHANAHKHFHLHPMIAGAIIAAGRVHGLRAVRVPAEDGAGNLPERLLAWWARRLGARLRRLGLATNDRVIGLAWSGAFTVERMRAALRDLPGGLTEIYTHPATDDHYEGAASGYRYREELAALTDPAVLAAACGAATGSFATMARRTLPLPAGAALMAALR